MVYLCTMTIAQQVLWEKVQRFELDDPQASFTFSGRLARENGWTLDYTLRAVAEYKRFIFLMCIASHPLTPSDQVDQVWHLHLLYTESYWTDLCGHTLQRPIHHGPTKGGNKEKNKFESWYDKTLTLYAETFSAAPPADIWPEPKIRFRDTWFRRVSVTRNWIIRKPSFLAP
jgi:hypothetical protein